MSDFEMSLFNFLINDFTPNQEFYNCSDLAAIQGTRSSQTILGWYSIITGSIFIAPFILCMIVGLTSELCRVSCYKIMFCASFFDILQLFADSIATGFYGIKGANFCDFPRSMFIIGALGCGSWFGGCLSCVTLAINRCCDFNPKLKLGWIFQEKRIYFIFFLIISYATYGSLFIKPPLFQSDHFSWFFNPQINNNPELYKNLMHTVNNCSVSIITTSTYIYLCVLINKKSRHSSSRFINRTQRQVFFQSVIICSFNALAAYIYVYMQYFYSPPVVIIFGQLAWQFSNGSVSIVYLTMNGTIQKGVYRMLTPKKFQTGSEVYNIPTTGNNIFVINRPVVLI